MINSILTALNDKLKVGGIFCDLQKAFNCLNHKILLDKMKFYGIHGKFYGTHGKFYALNESYLKERFQRVKINNNNDYSNAMRWKIINNGVPQGSILGPLFFLIYVNDLPRVIGNKYFNFKDELN